jgi:ABC-2 type transport system permease protein
MSGTVGAAASHPFIRGPSALGADRMRFWQLLWLTSRTEFKLRYHGSILGYAWSLLHPLLFFGVIYLFFSQVIRFGGEVEHYAALLLFNIMVFNFFSEASTSSVTSLVSRERMLRTTELPRIVIPLSGVLTSMFTLSVGLPVAFLFMLVSGVEPMWTWLLTPVIVALMFTVTLGMALILSTLYVTVRDMSQIWGVAARALFYASPVIYPISRVPESFRDIVYANPIAPILTQARAWLIDPSAPNALEAGGSLGLLPALAVFAAMLAVGFWLFIHRAPRIAELL